MFRGKRLELKLDAALRLLGKLVHQGEQIMSQLDDVLAAINDETNAIASAVADDQAVIAQLRADLNAAHVAGVVTPEQMATLATIQNRLGAVKDALVAIAATPAAPAPAPPVPADPVPAAPAEPAAATTSDAPAAGSTPTA